MQEVHKLAMLVDGENAQAIHLDKMLEEASKHGTVTIRRIYGNWTIQSMSQWRDAANKYAFQTPHQIRHTKGKNSTDSFMIIDAMKILHSDTVHGFCIVSSDSDFTGLVKHIREEGMFVMGIGKSTTPDSFKNACEIFTSIELLLGEPVKTEPAKKKWEEIVSSAINDEVQVTQSEWVTLAGVGVRIRNADSTFDPRTYGHKKLLLLIETNKDLFGIKKDEHGAYHVRANPKQI